MPQGRRSENRATLGQLGRETGLTNGEGGAGVLHGRGPQTFVKSQHGPSIAASPRRERCEGCARTGREGRTSAIHLVW